MLRLLRDRLSTSEALPLLLLIFVIWLGVQLFAWYNDLLHDGQIFYPVVFLTSQNVFEVSIPIFILVALVLLIIRIARPIGHWKRIVSFLVFFGFPIAILVFIFLGLFSSRYTVHGSVSANGKIHHLVSHRYAQFRCDPTCYPPHLVILECDQVSFICHRGWDLPEDEAFYGHFTANDFALVDESGGQYLTIILRDAYFDRFDIPLPLTTRASEDAT